MDELEELLPGEKQGQTRKTKQPPQHPLLTSGASYNSRCSSCFQHAQNCQHSCSRGQATGSEGSGPQGACHRWSSAMAASEPSGEL